jgi:hypothetical protein
MIIHVTHMSKCESIGGHRYCTVIIVIRKSGFVFIFLHKTKDEIQTVWTKCLNTLDDKHKLKTVRCDGAGEYIIQKFRSWTKDIYVTPFDRQFQCVLDEQMTKSYDQNGHTHTDTTTSSTPSPSVGRKAKILEDS